MLNKGLDSILFHKINPEIQLLLQTQLIRSVLSWVETFFDNQKLEWTGTQTHGANVHMADNKKTGFLQIVEKEQRFQVWHNIRTQE